MMTPLHPVSHGQRRLFTSSVSRNSESIVISKILKNTRRRKGRQNSRLVHDLLSRMVMVQQQTHLVAVKSAYGTAPADHLNLGCIDIVPACWPVEGLGGFGDLDLSGTEDMQQVQGPRD